MTQIQGNLPTRLLSNATQDVDNRDPGMSDWMNNNAGNSMS